MNEGQKANGVPAEFNDEWTRAWMDEHLVELRQSVSGPRIQYSSLLISFVVGLIAHAGGYALLSSFPSGPLGLLADLLHALGWSLWTGVVVVVFVQVIPEAKRGQIKRFLDAYEGLRRDKAQASGNRPEATLQRAPARRDDYLEDQAQRRNRRPNRRVSQKVYLRGRGRRDVIKYQRGRINGRGSKGFARTGDVGGRIGSST